MITFASSALCAATPRIISTRERLHIFPSQWEGSAKVTYEAAACGLPQITTREAGDVVRNGIEGIIVKPGDVNAIANGAGAFVSASGNCGANEQRSATSRRRELHLGPFSNAIARSLRNCNAHGAIVFEGRATSQIPHGGCKAPLLLTSENSSSATQANRRSDFDRACDCCFEPEFSRC